jgi:antirestriction protein
MAASWDELSFNARRPWWARLARLVVAAARACWAPVPMALGAVGLTGEIRLEECRSCGGDMVSPIEWHAVDAERWSLYLRCGQCGASRDAVASNAEVAEFEGALNAHQSAMERAAAELSALRMSDDVECFVEALRRDLIDAEDFRPVQEAGGRWRAPRSTPSGLRSTQ